MILGFRIRVFLSTFLFCFLSFWEVFQFLKIRKNETAQCVKMVPRSRHISRSSSFSRVSVYGLTSYFKLPDQGMKDYEVLSRGSCFPVKIVENEDDYERNDNLTFLFSGHVAAPYIFPHLYPHARDWLEFVRPEHVKVFVEIWNENQDEIRTFEIESLRKHPVRDIACGVLTTSSTTTKDFKAWNPLIVRPDLKIEPLQSITCHGHDIIDDTQKHPERLSVNGCSLFRTEHQVFLSTQCALPQGMCGGPVLDSDNGSSTLYGLIEGSIPIGTISETSHGEIGKVLHDKHGAVCVEPFDIHGLIMMRDGYYENI